MKSQTSPAKVGARALSNEDKKSRFSDSADEASQVDKKSPKPSVINDDGSAVDAEEASQRMSPEKQEPGAKKFSQMYDKMRIEQFDRKGEQSQ